MKCITYIFAISKYLNFHNRNDDIFLTYICISKIRVLEGFYD